jgi:hypothetical protein
MIRRVMLAALCALFADIAIAGEQRMNNPSRGELLYLTHCIACHSTQVHWRDKNLATDWSRLLSEVRHWEGFARLEWTEDDVAVVARYLNAMYYHYAVPE